MTNNRTMRAVIALLIAAPVAAQPLPSDAYMRFMRDYEQRQVHPQQPSPRYSEPPLRPLPMLPPLGTSKCTPLYVCDSAHVCVWQQVCQ